MWGNMVFSLSLQLEMGAPLQGPSRLSLLCGTVHGGDHVGGRWPGTGLDAFDS
jgi:hypothetical protein